MSNSKTLEEKGWPGGYFIEDGEVSRLEGRILTILETAGVSPKQEEALKSLVRQELWNTIGRYYVTSEQSTRLHRENQNSELHSSK